MKRVSRKEQIKKVLIVGGVAGAIAGILVTGIVAKIMLSSQEKRLTEENTKLQTQNEELQSQVAQKKAVEDSAELLASDSNGWALALVNEEYPLDTSYEPADLTEIETDRSVDSRIAQDLQDMLDAGKEEGLTMYVASAYRPYDKQREVFNSTMQDWIDEGYNPLDSYDETKKSVAVPGTSEHATGLAVDIISTEYEELDERQADTDEQQWLMEHCWEYGFILRYPEDKADITGIIFEPWHYRYVGKDVAKEITEKGITLEEYVLGE